MLIYFQKAKLWKIARFFSDEDYCFVKAFRLISLVGERKARARLGRNYAAILGAVICVICLWYSAVDMLT